MSAIISKAKSLIGNISESIASIRQSARGAKARIQELEAEHAQILTSPVTREDYIGMAHAEIDRKADAYKSKVAANIRMALTSKQTVLGIFPAPANVEFLLRKGAGQNEVGCLIGALRGADAHGDYDNRPLNQWAATFLLRDEMKLAATEAINAIGTWPHTDAAPYAESCRRLAEIEGELTALRGQLHGLQTDAEGAGIDLNGQEAPVPDASNDDAHDAAAGTSSGVLYAPSPDDPKKAEFLANAGNGKKVWRHIDPATGKKIDRPFVN